MAATSADNNRVRIEAFLSKASGSELPKSNESYTIQEAVWLFEAALNYGAIDPTARPQNIQKDHFEVRVNAQNGRISEVDLLNGFNAMTQELGARPIAGTDKLLAMDAMVKPITDQLIAFHLVRMTGQGQSIEFGALNTNFTGVYRCRGAITDVPNSLNPCGANLRGDKAIQGRINAAIGAIYVDQYLTDIESWTIQAYDENCELLTAPNLEDRILPAAGYPSTTPNNCPSTQFPYDDFLSFSTSDYYLGGFPHDVEPCLGPCTMALLTQNLWTLMGEVQSDRVGTNAPDRIACYVDGARCLVEPPPSGIYHFEHVVTFTYGRWNSGPNE